MRFNPLILVTVVLLLVVSSCEEDLGLREDYPEPFTLYGMLSPQLDIQSVWVFPLTELPDLEFTADHGIELKSTDIATGEQIIWKDSLIVADNGQVDIVFWAPFRPDYECTYRIEATRLSDGASSYADVRIPPEVVIRTEDIILPEIEKAILKIIVEGENVRPLKPELYYTVFSKTGPSSIGPVDTFTRIHHRTERRIGDAWEISINIWEDRLFVQNMYNVRYHAFLGIRPFVFVLEDVQISMIVGDAAWDPPFGRFDPNLLSHQSALNNVVNGLGFVGSGYRIVEHVKPGCGLITDAEYLCE